MSSVGAGTSSVMTDFARTSKPKLSAVLIVQNEAHCLETCLRSIRSIADEIIVIDSGSTDSTVALRVPSELVLK